MLFIICNILFVFFACTVNRSGKHGISLNESEPAFYKLAFENFGNDTICKHSTNKNYILCQKMAKDSLLNPNALIEFFVFSKMEQKIIYKDAISGASISWNNDTLLFINKQKGIITSTIDQGKIQYYINVKNQKLLPIDKKSSDIK